MNWLNIFTPTLRSPEFIGSEPIARATWLYVFAYCAEQENGGRIVGAKKWKDRQWQQTCGVTMAEVESSAPLITWHGDDLLLHAYPMNKEAEVQKMRELGRLSTERKAEAARKNGTNGGRPKTNPTETQRNGTQITQRKPIEGEGEGEGEWNRKEPPQDPPPVSPKPTGVGLDASNDEDPKWTPTEPQIRLGALFKRRSTTRWSKSELKAYRAILPIDEGDIQLLERYYKANIPPASDYRRRDLSTLLNNFTGEVDRARNWKPANVF